MTFEAKEKVVNASRSSARRRGYQQGPWDPGGGAPSSQSPPPPGVHLLRGLRTQAETSPCRNLGCVCVGGTGGGGRGGREAPQGRPPSAWRRLEGQARGTV